MIHSTLVRGKAAGTVLLAAAFALSSPLLAAPDQSGKPDPGLNQITGRWIATFNNPTDGSSAQTMLDLRADGATLIGAETAGSPPTIPIHDGTISGRKISFLTTRNSSQNSNIAMKYSGEVKGNTLSLSRKLVGADGRESGTVPPLVLRRIAEPARVMLAAAVTIAGQGGAGHRYPAHVEITGRWIATFKNPIDGSSDQAMLDLRADGSKLFGMETASGPPTIPIHDGTVSGASISFLTTRNAGQNSKVVVRYSGEVKGDELLLVRAVVGTSDHEGGTYAPLALKRVLP